MRPIFRQITLFLTAFFFTCCNQNLSKEKRLNISFNTQPNTLDPRFASDFISSSMVCLLYEGLTRYSGKKEVDFALAERVEISKNEKCYIFHLRKAFWSDGSPISAYDFERSWKEIIYPPRPSAFLFYPIKNAEKIARGELSIEKIGIQALNETTLYVELERPTPYFFALTAFPSFLPAPIDPKLYSGPFQIHQMTHNNEIILHKNQKFWNQKETHLDEIHISIIPDEMTALQMFERGQLDWVGGSLSPLPIDAINTLKEKLLCIPTPGSTFCTFNTQKFPFNNSNLRKAFSYAIDREKIAEGKQIPAKTVLPPMFSKQKFDLFNPTKAKIHLEKGLEELGIERKDLECLTLNFRTTQIEKRVAQMLQKQWENSLGITVQLNQLDFKSHTQKLHNKDYELSLATWIAQFDDPISLLDRFKYNDHLKNYSGWLNEEFINYLKMAEFPKERNQLFIKAEELLATELPITPLYHWNAPALASRRIKNIETSPCGGILFERVLLHE